MLLTGILLLIAGIVVFRFVANGQSKSFIDRPMLFNNGIAVLLLHLVWLVLLGLGLYFLWQVQPLIVLVLICVYIALWILGYFMGSTKSKARKVFKIYKQLKLYKPQSSQQEICALTATSYYKSLNWNERKIQMTVEAILENKTEEDTDIKDIAQSIFNFETNRSHFGENFDFKTYLKRSSAEQAAIEAAYEQVIGTNSTSSERPELSDAVLQMIATAELNPEEMSNEQLQVFAEMDDHSKSGWIIKILYGIAGASLLLAVISVLFLDWWSVVTYLTVSFALWFIGNKLQMRRISKKFHEASIAKYAMEQSQEKRE